MKKHILIFIYSRKSKYTNKGDSIGNQIELAKEYIDLHYPNSEYDVETRIYEDEGFSGGNIDRPNFQRMMKDELKYHADILICYRLDRISRNISDFSSLMEQLKKYNTDFVSIKEQFDTKTPMGRAMMYIASVFAQLEREVIAERIRDNMHELAKTGRWLGGLTPTGFTAERYDLVQILEKNIDNQLERKVKKACKLIEDKTEKKIIIDMANIFLEKKSLAGTETELINRNILSRTGVFFSTSRIRAILTNPVYATYDEATEKYFEENNIELFVSEEKKGKYGKYGLIAYNKTDSGTLKDKSEWIVAVGEHRGFFSGLEWIKIQDIIDKNKDKRYRASNRTNNALLSGILRCDCCGSFMRPKATGNQPKNANYRRYYYTCELKDRSKGSKCNGKNINGIVLDNEIVKKLKEIFIPNSDIYNELKSMSISKKDNIKSRNEEIEILDNKYKKNSTEIHNLVEKLKYIDVSIINVVNDEIKRLQEENNSIQEQITVLKKDNKSNRIEENFEKSSSQLVLDIINNYFNIFDELDIKLKKDILRLLIKDVKGNGEKVTVNLLNTNIDAERKTFFFDSFNKIEDVVNSPLEHDSDCDRILTANSLSSPTEYDSSCDSYNE